MTQSLEFLKDETAQRSEDTGDMSQVLLLAMKISDVLGKKDFAGACNIHMLKFTCLNSCI